MKIRICTICGQEFESHNGILVCSEECKAERKRQQDQRGNYRRYNKLSNVPETKKCPICGKKFEALPHVKYCGKECYEVAQKEKSKENFASYYADEEWKKKHQSYKPKSKMRQENEI